METYLHEFLILGLVEASGQDHAKGSIIAEERNIFNGNGAGVTPEENWVIATRKILAPFWNGTKYLKLKYKEAEILTLHITYSSRNSLNLWHFVDSSIFQLLRSELPIFHTQHRHNLQ